MKHYIFNLWKFILVFSMLLAMGCSSNIRATTTNTPTLVSTNASVLTPPIATLSDDKDYMGKIAFVYSHGKYDIFVMNVDGSGLKNLTANLSSSNEPSWSPDDQYIVFTSHPDLIPQISIMKADGSDPKQLTFSDAGSHAPSWSPDGKYIIFLSERDGVLSTEGTPIQQIYIMRFDGSEQHRLLATNNFVNSLSWSPKGDMIAASIGIPGDSKYSIQIYLLGLDGAIQKQLTQSGINERPTWSPDGAFVAFNSLQSDCGGINVIKADGTNQICLIGNTYIASSSLYSNNLNPSWSPNGKYVAFSSNRKGNYDLYIVKSDGSGLSQLTNMPGDELEPAWSPAP